VSVHAEWQSAPLLSLDPITEKYDLACDPDHAFDVYARHIGDWWHPDYTEGAETFTEVTIEPHVGGSVIEHHSTGETHEWGRVTDWQPAQRLAYTSNLARAGGDPGTITVTFTPIDNGGPAVDFGHGGWNDSNAHGRFKFTEWRNILDRFATMADTDPAR
jgi:uncharacterized protein YndB with AHSA1/START domain